MSLPLEIPPGIVKVDSPNAAKGRFTDADKIRFYKGKAEKWKGWQALLDDVVLGLARGAVSWTNQYGNTNVSIGTHIKLYALTGDDTLTDITPIVATGTLTNPFTTTNLSAVVNVLHVAHGRDNGDYVHFDGATAVGGITVAGEYTITFVDNDNYTISHSSAATSTAGPGGGAGVDYEFELAVGNGGTVVGLGWGAGKWGRGTWSTPRTDGIILELRHWSLAEYGNDLLASPLQKSLYFWQEATDDRAEVVTNAPASIRAIFVTGERFIMALGTSTPMTIEWPDQDDMTDWTPSATNSANIRTLQVGSKLVNGTPLTDGANLVWSDTAAYVFQYTGSDFIYDSRLAGRFCGLAAPLGFASVNGAAYWISSQRFYMFAGSVQFIPNQDDVLDYVFRDMDAASITKTWCIYDQMNNQIRWGYCSVGSAEPNKYVDVDLDDFVWTTGTLSRTTGTLYRPSDSSMIMVDPDGVIWSHNEGLDDGDAPLDAYVTYPLMAVANGDQNVDIMGIIPDCERQIGDLEFTVFTKDRPNSAANFDEGVTTLAPTDVIADIRVSGRHGSMTVRSNELGGDFRLGIVNLEIQNSGRRR